MNHTSLSHRSPRSTVAEFTRRSQQLAICLTTLASVSACGSVDGYVDQVADAIEARYASSTMNPDNNDTAADGATEPAAGDTANADTTETMPAEPGAGTDATDVTDASQVTQPTETTDATNAAGEPATADPLNPTDMADAGTTPGVPTADEAPEQMMQAPADGTMPAMTPVNPVDPVNPGQPVEPIEGMLTVDTTDPTSPIAPGDANTDPSDPVSSDFAMTGDETGNNNPAPMASLNAFQIDILQRVNIERAGGATCGNVRMPAVPALQWQSKATVAAMAHNEFMSGTGTFSHTGENGSTVGDRLTATGYQWRRVGENIAAGYPDSESVMRGWMSSPGHCRNIMRAGFTEVGVAMLGAEQSNFVQTSTERSRGPRSYWTMVLATPR